jgi:hypothetical protein
MELESWYTYGGVAEGAGLLEWDAVSLGEHFTTFWRILMPSSLETSATTRPTTQKQNPEDLCL